MATHKSAEKRHRQNVKRRARNRLAKATFRTALKQTTTLAQAGKQAEAKEAAKAATTLLDKAAIHGIIHKKTAARKISRLQKKLNRIASQKSGASA